MSAAFLPGFAQDEERSHPGGLDNFSVSNGTIPICGFKPDAPPAARATGSPELYDRRWDAFAFRVKHFTGSLSPARRAEIARRPRFRNQPYLRAVAEPDLDYP